MPKLFKFLIVFLVLFVHLFTDLSQADGMVLCFEQDGSVQLEKAYQNSCVSHIDKEHEDKEEGFSKNHCSDCVDVPIFSEHNCITSSDNLILSNELKKIRALNTDLKPYLAYEVLVNHKKFQYFTDTKLIHPYNTELLSLDTVILLI